MSLVSLGDGSTPRVPLGGASKRIFDVLGALCALTALSPLLLLAAALVRLSGRPVLVPVHFVSVEAQLFQAALFRTGALTELDAPLKSEISHLGRRLRD